MSVYLGSTRVSATGGTEIIGDYGLVRYDQPQGLTETQKTQARDNIDAVGKNNIELGIHTDGLIYIFIDGEPIGNGISQSIISDVVGYVDSDNNIILDGALENGTYFVKYEMENGTTVNIGELVLDGSVLYSVKSYLTNCTNENNDTEVSENSSYSATISANDGYELSSVVVTMGGTDITSTVVSGGDISIANVTGDIVITAVAEQTVVLDPVTETITLTRGIRIGSDGGDRTQAGYCATPHIDLTNIPKPCTIHLTKAKWAFEDASMTGGIMYYATKADGTKLVGGCTNDTVGSGYFTVVRNDGKNTDVTVTVTSDEVATIRFSGWYTNSEVDADWGYTDWGDVMYAEATLTYTPVA